MGAAAHRDSIASEYATGYAIVFDTGLPLLADALRDGAGTLDAIVSLHLGLLASHPDTLIERKAGAVWAVGRVVNPHERNGKAARAHDYVFEGYELEDALEQANAALEDDLTVSESDGRTEHCRPFTRDEVLKPLEAWFFGRST